MSSSRRLPVVRGAVAASTATFLALMSHLIGGGEVPGMLGIAVPWVLSLPVCVMLAGRSLSLWRLSVSVVISQVLFHVLFVLGAPSTGSSNTISHAGHGAHGVEMMMPVAGAPAHTAAMHADPAMWMWHGIAAVVTIATMYRGERALLQLRTLAAQMIAWVRRRFGAAVPSSSPIAIVGRLVSQGWTTASLSDGAELTPLRRRGPPLRPYAF